MDALAAMPKYVSYKDSGVDWLGSIPKSWALKPGLVAFSENKRNNKGMKESTVLSLSYGKIVIKPEEKLVGLVPESFETYQLVEPSDIIIRCTDLQNDKVSLRTGLAQDKGIITSAYLNLKVKKGFSSRFLHYYLHSLDTTKVIYKFGSGLRQNLSFLDFKRLPVFDIPEATQEAIANFLDQKTAQIDEAVAIKEKQIALLKERKQIIVQKAVTQGLNPDVPMKDSGVDWIGDIPEQWDVVKLGHLVDKLVDGTHHSPQSNDEGDYLYITSKNIKEHGVDLRDVSYISSRDHLEIYARCPVERGDILYIKDGAMAGVATVNQLEEPFSLLSSVALIKPKKNLLSNYLKIYLNSEVIRGYLKTQLVGGAMTRLTLELINKFKVVVPSIKDQENIVNHIGSELVSIEDAIETQLRQIERLKEYKTTLINSAITGKIKVA